MPSACPGLAAALEKSLTLALRSVIDHWAESICYQSWWPILQGHAELAGSALTAETFSHKLKTCGGMNVRGALEAVMTDIQEAMAQRKSNVTISDFLGAYK
jgi:hypothetical protein